jgi:hypothetical protein
MERERAVSPYHVIRGVSSIKSQKRAIKTTEE